MTDEQRKRIHKIVYSCDDRAEMAERIVVLEDENAKMRELVRDMWDAALHPETFGDGSHLLMRMRDLGIEVEA